MLCYVVLVLYLLCCSAVVLWWCYVCCLAVLCCAVLALCLYIILTPTLTLNPATALAFFQTVTTGDAVFLAPDGDFARFENRRDEELDFMLIEAEPTGEQVSARVRGDTMQ